MARKKIIVIGAGAAGLMAAAAAGDAGADVTVYERNEKAGKKIYITGKGRCNFTNVCDTYEFFDSVVRNPKFLYSAVYGFDQQQVIDFMENNGCRTKVERGKRAFPESDHASDITRALTDHLKKNKSVIRYNKRVKKLLTRPYTPAEGSKEKADRQVVGVVLADGTKDMADAVIIATGGRSYTATGSTGDGYKLAESLGLEVRPQSPALVPFRVRESWPEALSGLSLKNVEVSLYPAGEAAGKKKKPVYSGFGEMLFTHFGISGPLILSASSYADFDKYPEGFVLHLNLKPALTIEQLENRIAREIDASHARSVTNMVRTLLPGGLGGAVLAFAGIDPDKASGALDQGEINRLCQAVSDLTLDVIGTRGFEEAIVTKGGIAVKEIDPSTMETRKVKGLFCAGEVIDVDALTGGYNLQIAWSTGHLAGVSCMEDQ